MHSPTVPDYTALQFDTEALQEIVSIISCTILRSARDSCKFNRDNVYNSVGDKKRLKDFFAQYSQSDL